MRNVLWSALRGRPGTVTRLLLWSILEMAPTFACGYGVARAIDDGFLRGRVWVGIGWLGLVLVGVVAGAAGTRGVIPHVGDIVEPLRDRLVTQVVTAQLRRAVAGALVDSAAIAGLTTQVEAVRTAFAAFLLVVRGFAVAVAGALLGLLALSPGGLVLTLPPMLLALGLFAASASRLFTRQHEVNVTEERVAAAAGELVDGLRDIVACGAEPTAEAETGRRIDEQVSAARALAYVSVLRYAALGAGGWLPLALLVLGIPWLLGQGVSAGAVLGTVTYVVGGLQPALKMLVNGVGNSGVVLVATLGRLLDTAREPESEPAVRRPPYGTDLVVRGLSFRYQGGAEPVLTELDLDVPGGDHLAVMGPSGTGKSTLARLLVGLHRPTAGHAWYGDIPVDAVEFSHRALIPQEAYVFAGTLRENLTYLSPAATDADVTAAAYRLGLELERLGGLDAELNPRRLSAGERQLVAAVRTYLSPASLVVLDEATCHLDAYADARVESAFAERPGTLIVVAHRLSSALRARHVLILDGDQVWHGTPDEAPLLAADQAAVTR